MDAELARFFLAEASKAFAFLVTEHSFAAPQLRIDDNIDFAFVEFVAKNLAVECILDEREADINCKIALVVDGKKTSHYARDEHGVRVREGLANLLRRRGVRERLFEQVGGLDIHDHIKVTLAAFAKMLKSYGNEILNDSRTALV